MHFDGRRVYAAGIRKFILVFFQQEANMGAFIFVPVPSDAATKHLNAWGTGREQRGKQPYQVLMNLFSQGSMKGFVRGVGLGCLSRVKTNEKLYVYGHGAAGVGTKMGGDRNDGFTKVYSASELADLLVAEGLPKTHHDLRLYFCESGLGDQPFALQLKNAMVARGYNSITVTGYMGDVRPSYAFRQTTNGGYTQQEHKGVERGGFIFRASQFRRRF
jgi:hypothetical protein